MRPFTIGFAVQRRAENAEQRPRDERIEHHRQPLRRNRRAPSSRTERSTASRARRPRDRGRRWCGRPRSRSPCGCRRLRRPARSRSTSRWCAATWTPRRASSRRPTRPRRRRSRRTRRPARAGRDPQPSPSSASASATFSVVGTSSEIVTPEVEVGGATTARASASVGRSVPLVRRREACVVARFGDHVARRRRDRANRPTRSRGDRRR